MSQNKDKKILIIGAGPAGLGAALAFRNNNYKNITVLEAREDMNFDITNSYPIGVNIRGQKSISKLFGKDLDFSKIGLTIDQWKVVVGPGLNVANFHSGYVYGTSRAEVTCLLYEEALKRGIKVLFGLKAKDIRLEDRILICENKIGDLEEFKSDCLIIADGYRSRVRDILSEMDKSLKVEQWPWNVSFRVLISDYEPKTELNSAVHYILNQIYLSKFKDGRWSAGIAIKEDSPSVLSSNDPSDKKIEELKRYLKKLAPESVDLFTDEEYKRYFSRNIFNGSITRVSKLVVDNWAVLIGDAAHSAIPATGEGINSALEDCYYLQKSLSLDLSLEECLEEFEKSRLEDVQALSDIAYSAANAGVKNRIQSLTLGLFKKFVGPVKEDLLFGKNSLDTKRYSEIVKVWQKQTFLLGGPTLAPRSEK